MDGQMFEVKPNFLLTNEHPNLVIVPMMHQVRGEKQECVPLTLLNLAEGESIFLKNWGNIRTLRTMSYNNRRNHKGGLARLRSQVEKEKILNYL